MSGGMHRRPRIILLAAAFVATIITVGSATGAGSGYGQQAPSNTAAPSISGTLAVGSALTAANGSWSGVAIQTYSYQWKRCDLGGNGCVAITGAKLATFLLGTADGGTTLRVTVTATNKNGSTAATSAQTGAVPAPAPASTPPPANSSPPQLTGIAQVGNTLSSSTGTWTGSPTSYRYQWQRCGSTCASVSGATNSTYALTSADVGSTMRVQVTATNTGGSASALSNATAAITAAPAPVVSAPASTAPPQVTGTDQAGQTLTTSTGTWTGSPTVYGYQWMRCDSAGGACAAVSGASAKTFALTSTDVGKTLRATVTASNAGGSTSATSTQTPVVSAAPAPTTGDVYSQPVPHYGVSPGYTILNRTSAMQDFELSQIASIGAKAVRLDYWEEAKADVTIGKAIAHGLEPELVIGATMSYSGRDTVSDFQSRCSRAATKYHGKVRYYEPLNEPNSNGWPASDFVQYQKACYQAIKAVDSRNVVYLSGLNPATTGNQVVQWVAAAYAAGLKGSYDVMNPHLYGDPAKQATWSLWCKTFGCGGIVSPSIVDVMKQYGDGGKPVVSTESGDNAGSAGETAQATAVAGALVDPRLSQAYVYDMLNTVTGFGMLVPDSTGTVVDPTGAHWRKRPAYTAYVNNA